ncbi:MAG: pyridoxamine 5'-phosphate oxidase family protein [Spirochaetes bacterium]|nr:pyridoxamine 5'-phosphate oxidase family protein [Spirochaetota bacterium]
MNIELDYKKCYDEAAEVIRNTGTMILATSENNRVTARNMSFVFDGTWLYFQTDVNFLKTEQIRSNPNVAVAFSNYQIEGVAEELGRQLPDTGSIFLALFKEKHPGSYERYSLLPGETVFRIKPAMITIWKYIDGEPYRDFISIAAEKAWRTKYGE